MKKRKCGLNMARGGMVHGPGGPTDDLVPVNLSDGEAVLPAETVQAVGGPEAVEGLIEQTTGRQPAKGLRAGGRYYGGMVDDYGNRIPAAQAGRTPPVTVNDSVTGEVVKPNVRPTITAQQDMRGAPAAQPAPSLSSAQTAQRYRYPELDMRYAVAGSEDHPAMRQARQAEFEANRAAGEAHGAQSRAAVDAELKARQAGGGGGPKQAAADAAKQTGTGAKLAAGAKTQAGRLMKGAGLISGAMGAADALDQGFTSENLAMIGMGALSSDTVRGMAARAMPSLAPALGVAGAAAGVGSAGYGGYQYGESLNERIEGGEKLGMFDAALGALGENLGKGYARYAPEVLGGLPKADVQRMDEEDGGRWWTTTRDLRQGQSARVNPEAQQRLAQQTQTAQPTQTQAPEQDADAERIANNERIMAQANADEASYLQRQAAMEAGAATRSTDQGGLRASITEHSDMPGINVERDAQGKIIGYSGGNVAQQPAASPASPLQQAIGGQQQMSGGGAGDFALANERMARVNQIRNEMTNLRDGRDPNWQRETVSNQVPTMGYEREQFLKQVMTPHKGAQNKQLTIGQMRLANDMMNRPYDEAFRQQDLNNDAARATGLRGGQGGAGEPSLRDQIALAEHQRNLSKDGRAAVKDTRDFLTGRSDTFRKDLNSALDRLATGDDGRVDPKKRTIYDRYASTLDLSEATPEEAATLIENGVRLEQLIQKHGGYGPLGLFGGGDEFTGEPTRQIRREPASLLRGGGETYVTNRGQDISTADVNSWPKADQDLFYKMQREFEKAQGRS